MTLSVGTLIPCFDGATAWLNGNEPVHETLQSRPTLVHFWAMSCPACKANMPDVQTLRDKYAPLGLQTVAVHLPRGPFDINADAVRAMTRDLGMTEPCAIDDDAAIGERFQTGELWPVYFVFGPTGKLKVRAAGGFGFKMCERALQKVFGDVS